MAEAALADGITTVVATPHCGVELPGRRVIQGWADDLRRELAARGISLDLASGGEVSLGSIGGEMPLPVALPTLGGSRYLLVELPLGMPLQLAERLLFRMQVAGVVPVLAHPERHPDLAESPEILRGFVDRGMLVQLTSASLEGVFGGRVRRFSEELLSGGLAHVIASDAHSLAGRGPQLSGGLRRAAELVGEETALAMVTTVPRAILEDRVVELPHPSTPPRRSRFLRRIWRR